MEQYIITVSYDAEYNLYQARCEALPTLFVDAPTMEELIEAVEAGVPFIVNTLSNQQSLPTDKNIVPLYMMKHFMETGIATSR